MTELVDFPNFGYLLDDVPLNLMSIIRKEVNEVSSKEGKVVRNINRHYRIDKSAKAIEPFVLDLVRQYENKYGHLNNKNVLLGSSYYSINKLWVNFQSKFEFNPSHRHPGYMSFVVWLKVPYTMEQENEVSPGQNNQQSQAGKFEFTYGGTTGDLLSYSLPVDVSYEGKILLFPSVLRHCVYPFFSSDEYRISAAGDVVLKTKEHGNE